MTKTPSGDHELYVNPSWLCVIVGGFSLITLRSKVVSAPLVAGCFVDAASNQVQGISRGGFAALHWRRHWTVQAFVCCLYSENVSEQNETESRIKFIKSRSLFEKKSCCYRLSYPRGITNQHTVCCRANVKAAVRSAVQLSALRICRQSDHWCQI